MRKKYVMNTLILILLCGVSNAGEIKNLNVTCNPGSVFSDTLMGNAGRSIECISPDARTYHHVTAWDKGSYYEVYSQESNDSNKITVCVGTACVGANSGYAKGTYTVSTPPVSAVTNKAVIGGTLYSNYTLTNSCVWTERIGVKAANSFNVSDYNCTGQFRLQSMGNIGQATAQCFNGNNWVTLDSSDSHTQGGDASNITNASVVMDGDFSTGATYIQDIDKWFLTAHDANAYGYIYEENISCAPQTLTCQVQLANVTAQRDKLQTENNTLKKLLSQFSDLIKQIVG